MLPQDLDPAQFSARRLIQRFADPTALTRAAADEVVRRLVLAVQQRGGASIALAGGSTPKSLYRQLAEDAALRDRLPWSKVHFFFGDERHVSPDHSDSNFRMAHEAMFDRLPAELLPEANIHRIRGELPEPEQAAIQYAQELEAHFGQGHLPQFDVMLLGMGPDGHTASIFPGTSALRENAITVCAVWIDKLSTHRITMTPPVLRHARSVIFLVAGPDKARVLKSVLEGPPALDRYPAQGIYSLEGETLWLADTAAAATLQS
ncbi:hypothetical protein AYO41_04810 [Verrucomicrobia bacterium SCGC AG-212-E04]|nr:hypothetical protein AYO41_04810 [Verrucomicrobia bacterium SCGC AG-212-E04]